MDNKQLYTEIGLKIRSFRKSRGMTLIELAQLINKKIQYQKNQIIQFKNGYSTLMQSSQKKKKKKKRHKIIWKGAKKHKS